MSEKKRRWFQIHLSTAIVLMFVAGGLLGANLNKTTKYYDDGVHPGWRQYGWPWPCWTEVVSELHEVGTENKVLVAFNAEDSRKLGFGDYPNFDWVVLIWNLVAALLLVVVLACGMEFIIRRREARKP